MVSENGPGSWSESADIVIVGSGFAGLAAAIEARLSGSSVVVLEKMKTPGGNSSISDGCLSAAGTDEQEAAGVEDSPELMAEDMIRAGLGLNHPDLVRVVTRKSAEVFRWTKDYLGVRYMDRLDRFGGHSVARSLTTYNNSGSAIVRRQLERLRELGVSPRTGTILTRIVREPGGPVLGVECREGYRYGRNQGGPSRTIQARQAVILASGGFGSDVAFRTTQNPRLDRTVASTNHRGATAEALIKALGLGAAPVHLSWIQLGPWACPDEKGYGPASSFASFAVFPGGIVVDPATGKRFFNELADRRIRAEAILEKGRACVGIVDSLGADRCAHRLGQCLKKGYVRAFDSLSLLAREYGIPVDDLEESVGRYNLSVKNGEDQDWGKPLVSGASPLDKPPYYAIRLWPKVHFTMGGIRINAQARVLDLEGMVIPRFYAAGEVTGGVHGASRLGSTAISECLVFGRVAGKNAATGETRG